MVGNVMGEHWKSFIKVLCLVLTWLTRLSAVAGAREPRYNGCGLLRSIMMMYMLTRVVFGCLKRAGGHDGPLEGLYRL